MPIPRRRLLRAALLTPAIRPGLAQSSFITLASTTSTEQSGLFPYLLPLYRQQGGAEVRVVAVGTGQAMALGRRGDADALLVHDPEAEASFVAEGWGIDRRDVMYNDFILIGPAEDPAGISGGTDAAAALVRIAATGATFASRGDDSGTHRQERRLWQAAGVQPWTTLQRWYRELGQGMGPTLNAAAAMPAYTLADRATWAHFRNRQGLRVLVQGDRRLFNQYGSILVNPARHPSVKLALARHWHGWLTGPAGQAAIAGYAIEGNQVFFPNATAS